MHRPCSTPTDVVNAPALGQEECEAAVGLLEEEARKVRRRASGLKLLPVPLYAGLPAANQLQAFEVTPRGYRKVGPIHSSLLSLSMASDNAAPVMHPCCRSSLPPTLQRRRSRWKALCL